MAEDKEQDLSRRNFAKIAGGAAAGVALVSLAGCASKAGSTGPAGAAGPAGPAGAAGPNINSPGAVFTKKYDVDVVVVGGGHGGVISAVSAAEAGAKVLLIDICSKTGGGCMYGPGTMGTFGIKDYAEYQKYTEGLQDPDLSKVFFDTFWNTFNPWLTSTKINAYVSASTTYAGEWIMGKGEAGALKGRLYFDSLEKTFTGLGGTILPKTRGLKLLTDQTGKVAGVRASTWSKSPLEKNQATFDIAAKAVILATGSFFCNPEMMQAYVGPWADLALAMGPPYNRGDAIIMAQPVGAALSKSMSTYAATLAAITTTKPGEMDPEAYEAAITANLGKEQNLSAAISVGRIGPPAWIGSWRYGATSVPTYGILVNLDGNRFMDEASRMEVKQQRTGQNVINQRYGMAFVIGDSAIYNLVSSSKASIDAITAAGGKVITANTLTDFAAALGASYNMYAGDLLNTINQYNNAVNSNTAGSLNPPRSGGLYPISTPPFYAIPVRAAVLDNFGGLAVNKNAEVLDAQRNAIPSLYAVPQAAGGIMNSIWGGATAISGTFGYIAGKSVAAYVKS